MSNDIVLALLAAGLLIVVASSLGALLASSTYVRIHFLTPITSLGLPCIGLALAVDNGWGLTTAEVLFIVFVVGVSGPVIGSATAKVLAERDGLINAESSQ